MGQCSRGGRACTERLSQTLPSMYHDSQLALLPLNQPNSDCKVPKLKFKHVIVSYITASRAGLDVQSGEKTLFVPNSVLQLKMI